MSTRVICTIAAANYLSRIRVLHASCAAVHPDVPFVALVVDDEVRDVPDADYPFSIVRPGDTGLPPGEVAILAAIYDVTELATALKPWLLRYLQRQGAERVIYLDPDVQVFAPLDMAFGMAAVSAAVLTPHTTAPLPRDGRCIANSEILAAGVYNLGFVAVGPKSGPFLDWWWGQTRREALSAPDRMMFTDQRWIDMAPCFFDCALLKHPGYNVAYWNLHARDVTRLADGTYGVDGEPLVFFHFSGFDPKAPHLLSRHQRDMPRILLSERPVVAGLCRAYAAALAETGAGQATPYGWDRAGGVRLTPFLRRMYWKSVVTAEAGGKPVPSGPFDPSGPEAFLAWLNERILPAARPFLSRYLVALHDGRPDLRRAFPDVNGADAAAYLAWVPRHGVGEEEMPPVLQPTDADMALARQPRFAAPEALGAGVNLAGYFRAELGIGQAGRLLSVALDAAAVPYQTVLCETTVSRQEEAYTPVGDGRASFDVNLLAVNADALPAYRARVGQELFEHRYTIGYWFWEVEDFPPSMWPAFDSVDEVWVASTFVADAISRVSRVPVYCLPPPFVPPEPPEDIGRGDLGLPDGFLFLFVFDYLSVFERKNPCDLVDAFARAFAPGEGPRLVIKTINGLERIADRERLAAHVAGRPDILVIEHYLTSTEQQALMARCDAYVSLHRSEGLGLTMAEAMALGKPVIATNYSGNRDFMTPGNSFLVDCSMVPVPAGCDPYPAGTSWAQPDVAEAARLMRRVYDDPDEAGRRGARARADIVTKHGPGLRGAAMAGRLAAIRSTRGAASAAAAANPVATVAGMLETAVAHVLPVGRRSGWRGLVRRALFRILQPYSYSQRVLRATLVDALRLSDEETAAAIAAARDDAERRHARTERRLDQALARLAQLERGARRPVEEIVDSLGNGADELVEKPSQR